MGFNSGFKGLKEYAFTKTKFMITSITKGHENSKQIFLKKFYVSLNNS